MAILIKNMKMPEDGRYTVTIMHDSSGDVHWVFQNQDTMEFLKHGTVEEIHNNGRLIDADEIFNNLERTGWYDNADRDIAEDLVLDAPTIIEAEEVE